MTTGIKGVYRAGRRFRAFFPMGTGPVYLGTYDTIEEAVAAQTKFLTERGKRWLRPTEQ